MTRIEKRLFVALILVSTCLAGVMTIPQWHNGRWSLPFAIAMWAAVLVLLWGWFALVALIYYGFQKLFALGRVACWIATLGILIPAGSALWVLLSRARHVNHATGDPLLTLNWWHAIIGASLLVFAALWESFRRIPRRGRDSSEE